MKVRILLDLEINDKYQPKEAVDDGYWSALFGDWLKACHKEYIEFTYHFSKFVEYSIPAFQSITNVRPFVEEPAKTHLLWCTLKDETKDTLMNQLVDDMRGDTLAYAAAELESLPDDELEELLNDLEDLDKIPT